MSELLQRPRNAWLVLGLAMCISTTWLLIAGDGLTFVNDDIFYYAQFLVHGTSDIKPSGGAEYFLAPSNGHLQVAGKLLYRAIFEVAGANYFVFRAVDIAGVMICVGLFFELARRGVGPLVALIPSISLLFLGFGWEAFLWAFDLHTIYALALGLGAVLALQRDDRAGDVAACVLLILSIAMIELGLAFAVGIGISVLLRSDRLRRAWIFFIPLGLYACWWIWSRHFDQPAIVLSKRAADSDHRHRRPGRGSRIGLRGQPNRGGGPPAADGSHRLGDGPRRPCPGPADRARRCAAHALDLPRRRPHLLGPDRARRPRSGLVSLHLRRHPPDLPRRGRCACRHEGARTSHDRRLCRRRPGDPGEHGQALRRSGAAAPRRSNHSDRVRDARPGQGPDTSRIRSRQGFPSDRPRRKRLHRTGSGGLPARRGPVRALGDAARRGPWPGSRTASGRRRQLGGRAWAATACRRPARRAQRLPSALGGRPGHSVLFFPRRGGVVLGSRAKRPVEVSVGRFGKKGGSGLVVGTLEPGVWAKLAIPTDSAPDRWWVVLDGPAYACLLGTASETG